MVKTSTEWSPVGNWLFLQVRNDLSLSPSPVRSLTFCTVVPLALQLGLLWPHCALMLWYFSICWDGFTGHTLGSIWNLLSYIFIQKVSYCPECVLGLACLLPQVLKKLLFSEKGSSPIPLWTDFRDVLVIVALLYCTCALHKIFSNEMTKEEVASLKKKINFHFAVMGLPSFPLNAILQMFTRVSLTRLDYSSGTNCFIWENTSAQQVQIFIWAKDTETFHSVGQGSTDKIHFRLKLSRHWKAKGYFSTKSIK